MEKLEKIVSLCKRRGFIFPGSEIYGGISGIYDYGPLGLELKFNIKQEWWNEIVKKRDDVVGLSSSIIMNPKVWEASGHVSGFSDPLIECKKCHRRYRSEDIYKLEDQFQPKRNIEKSLGEQIKEEGDKILKKRIKELIENGCETCGGKEFTKPRPFNLMFKTFVGPVETTASTAYLRPETAGGIFVNFKNILNSTQIKIPFGVAQIGKVFRNEINPKDYIFRTREFEQMELEYFVRPQHAEKYFKEWIDLRFKWYENLGLKNIRKREQSKEERAHYSSATIDIEYEFPFGWKEIEGIANRTDFDLKTHSRHSGEELSYTEDSSEKFIPYIIEPSAGPERLMLAFLCEAYHEEKDRVVLKLHPKLAPVKVAVFPLLANKEELVTKAKEVLNLLKSDSVIGTGAVIDLSKQEEDEIIENRSYSLAVSSVRGSMSARIAWDDRGNIGKRYYSQDEIGTPWCVTVDHQTLEDDAVTVRDRDTTKQERIKIQELKNYFEEKLK